MKAFSLTDGRDRKRTLHRRDFVYINMYNTLLVNFSMCVNFTILFLKQLFGYLNHFYTPTKKTKQNKKKKKKHACKALL